MYRHALRGPAPTGSQALVGERTSARTDIQSKGFVFVQGERWQAGSEDGHLIPAGTPVVVVAASGLRLVVRAEA